MASISGIYTALSGMNAQRNVLDTTAHNIANESSPGYHRQRAELKPAGIASVAAVFAGDSVRSGGVEATNVVRMIDSLAEERLVRERAVEAGAQQLSADLDRIEGVFAEPSDQGLAAVFDEFWGGWSELASLPGDTAMRTQVLVRAQTVVDGLRRASGDLDQIEQTARNSVVELAIDANGLADRIAQLNGAIASSTNTPNDLMDQRDALIQQLAALTGATARPTEGNQVNISIGGRVLVSGTFVNQLDGTGGVLTWQADGGAVTAPASKAASLSQTISDVVPRYRAQLDAVAAALVTTVNAVHAAGYDQSGNTGWNFFDPAGTTAATISVSTDVAGQPGRIAAGAPVFPGPVAPGPFDGEQARQLSLLADAATGPDAAYRSLVTGLGVETRAATRRLSIQQDVTRAAEAQAQSVGGVSIDEEMATLVAAQRAYEASARVLTTLDELLGYLIERTGVVGR